MRMSKGLTSTCLGLVVVVIANSCAHRSLLTEPFRDSADAGLLERELDPELLAALQAKLDAAETDEERAQISDELHAQVVRGRFPSAEECRRCHEEHFRQWSVSPHAYAQLSPVFNAMQGTIMKLTQGTNGDFCIRCHTPVGMTLGEKVFMTNLERHPTSREGVTCVVCHRINEGYGKVSGRFGISEGDIHDPIYGPTGNAGVAEVVSKPREYPVRTDASQTRGQPMHAKAERFFMLENAAFCGMCHDVNGPSGFRLEEAFSEYKQSPAAAQGVSCQDCHMSKDPGEAAGYASGPAALINGKPTRTRKITNHMFVGPDYSIVHPGIFPHNPKAVRDPKSLDPSGLATLKEWLLFDHEAGWGTPAFEAELANRVARGECLPEFPERWATRVDREQARAILDTQQALLAEQAEARKRLLQKGYRLGEVTQETSPEAVTLAVEVFNGTDGHSVPTGFTAERIVFLRVTARDADGEVVFASGDLDPNGDLRDSHSVYVHNGELPLDPHLFSLQSKFITTNERGGEREQILAVNHSQNPLAFVRPSPSASILTGRPSDARIHKRNIPPGGRRVARYPIPRGRGPIEVKVELIAGMVPVNLVSAIQHVGFDYGLSPREVARRVVAGHQVLWDKTLTLPAE